MTYAFVRPADLAAVGAPPASVVLQNPLREDQSVMRTSLLPGLLHAVGHARRHGQRDGSLFTVGSLFLAPEEGLPQERLALTALLFGDRTGWLQKPEPVDVWDGKGVAEDLVFRILRRRPVVRSPAVTAQPPALHPRGAAILEMDGTAIGNFGPLHPDVAEAFEIDGPLVLVELDLAAAQRVGDNPLRFAPLPRFPASTRDLAVVVSDDVLAGDVERAAREAGGDLAVQVALFDRFRGGGVPQGHASLGLHIVYRAPDRTLTDAEVDTRHSAVVSALQTQFGATLRG